MAVSKVLSQGLICFLKSRAFYQIHITLSRIHFFRAVGLIHTPSMTTGKILGLLESPIAVRGRHDQVSSIQKKSPFVLIQAQLI
jgi:hypothetical protein